MITLNTNSYKCLHLINYITHHDIYSKMTIELIIYLADRFHLQNHYCTMYKEAYKKVDGDLGIIPECADLIIDDILEDKNKFIAADSNCNKQTKACEVLSHNKIGTKVSIIPICDYDAGTISTADRICINKAITYVFNHNVGEILNKIKSDIVYTNTKHNDTVNFISTLVKSVDIENNNTKENSIYEWLKNNGEK
jgi:hypothetical protein